MKQLQENSNISDIKNLVSDDLIKINQILTETTKGHAQLIEDVTTDIFQAGGKRIRPILNILCARLFDFNEERIYFLASAVELIHSATLLHDDVIDESKLRRGRQTANQRFDNKSAILVGDFIFAESFKLMVNANSIEALKCLASASSIISEGEVKQLELLKNKVFETKKYLEVINDKTAELFGAATESAARIAGRSTSEARLLKSFGINLGLAFQIIDDLLDYRSDSEEFGKKLGGDFYEGKITLPIIFLYDHVAGDLKEAIKRIFEKEERTSDDLNYITTLMDHKNIFDYVFMEAKKYVKEALYILKNFKDSKSKEILQAICYTVINREF